MRFLADVGVSVRTVAWLRTEGHDAVHLFEQGLHRLSDAEILLKARSEQRVLLTRDLDFGYLAAVSHEIRTPSTVSLALRKYCCAPRETRLPGITSSFCTAPETTC